MSEKALNTLGELFAQEVIKGDKDELPRGDAKEHLMNELDVIESTANVYIRNYGVLRKDSRKNQFLTGVESKDGGEPKPIRKAKSELSTRSQSKTATSESDSGTDDAANESSDTHTADITDIDAEVGEIQRVNLAAWNKSESDCHEKYECRDCGAFPALFENGTDEEFCIHCGAIHFNGLPKLEDVGHPLVPDVDGYLRRRMKYGKMSDVENVAFDMGDPDFATLLQGETGVGKDFLIKFICSKTNRPLVRVNFGEGIMYEDLVGGFQPTAQTPDEMVSKAESLAEANDISFSDAVSALGQQANFEFKPGFLYEAADKGYTFLADEINAAGPEATMPLHGVTEDADSRHLPVRQTSEVLDPDDRFKFVGTMNPPHYPGTQPLNEAFENRFWIEEMTWLPPKAEANMIYQQTPLDRDSETDVNFVDELTDALEKLRSSYKEQDIVTPISHRHARQIGVQAKRMDSKQATKKVLLSSADPGDENTIDKTIDMKISD